MADDEDEDCAPDQRLDRHETEWELFQLLEQVPVGIFVVTAAGKPYYANQSARRLLGIGEVPEHVSQFCEAFRAFEIGTDRLYPAERLPLVRALGGESCEISDIELRRESGVVPLHVSGAPMKLHGKLAFAVAALQDIRELRRIATSDALTGLPNRTAVADAFARERLLADRNAATLALAMIDFDGFKSINDTYGHAKGDEVLRRASATIVEALRRSDLVARWGGEELLVLMPNTNQQGAVRAIEKALDAVRALEVATTDAVTGGGATFRVTFSAGVVEAAVRDTLEDLVKRADALLYEAKRRGRDRVLAG